MAKKKRTGTSKLQMVRDAVGELGKDAMPVDLQNAVKQKHGVELPLKIVSNYKFLVSREGKRAGSKPGPKPGKKKLGRPKKTAVGRAAPAVGSNGGISLYDIRAVRSLAEKLGARKLLELAQVLS